MCCLLDGACLCEFLRSWHAAVWQLPPGWPQHAAPPAMTTVCINSAHAEPASRRMGCRCPLSAVAFDHLNLSVHSVWTKLYSLPNTVHRFLSISCQHKAWLFSTSLPLRKNPWLCFVNPCLTFHTDRHPLWNMLHKSTVTSNIWALMIACWWKLPVKKKNEHNLILPTKNCR